jgi:hypothetical protein
MSTPRALTHVHLLSVHRARSSGNWMKRTKSWRGTPGWMTTT